LQWATACMCKTHDQLQVYFLLQWATACMCKNT
jgi:hypothetical protein